MARLRVRYRSGETDEWTINERINSGELAAALGRAISEGGTVGFATDSEVGIEGVDYGFVGLRGNEMASWWLDGLVDFRDLATWEAT